MIMVNISISPGYCKYTLMCVATLNQNHKLLTYFKNTFGEPTMTCMVVHHEPIH